jgi:putative addiction module component (TIGR02574 family)
MSPDIQEIEEKALKLPSTERALLAERLISSLEGEEDAEAERLWINEAERRYREYKEGKVKARPAAQVFKEAFSKLA